MKFCIGNDYSMKSSPQAELFNHQIALLYILRKPRIPENVIPSERPIAGSIFLDIHSQARITFLAWNVKARKNTLHNVLQQIFVSMFIFIKHYY